MAAHLLAPVVDLVTIKEAIALLAETGHGISESTLKRALRSRNVRGERIGRVVLHSYTDVLEAHRDLIAARTR
ncbi:hypothetical protein ABZ694_25065 [Streptomyces albidoflavus]|uniref:hypothetical protein n=1 Tax=Streptomyces albidoflavus TaxID=1886 RepID=UPI00340F7A2C